MSYFYHQDSLASLHSLVLGVASARGVMLRGEEEWSPGDEVEEQEEEEHLEDEEEGMYLSDAETGGSDEQELTDYENSPVVEQRVEQEEEERQCWVCFAR